MVYVIILLLYLAALIFVGKLASRGVSSSDDWAVAGRSLGVWSSAASYFTTVLSAVSLSGIWGITISSDGEAGGTGQEP